MVTLTVISILIPEFLSRALQEIGSNQSHISIAILAIIVLLEGIFTSLTVSYQLKYAMCVRDSFLRSISKKLKEIGSNNSLLFGAFINSSINDCVRGALVPGLILLFLQAFITIVGYSFILYRNLGALSVIPIIMLILYIFINLLGGKKISEQTLEQQNRKDKRIQLLGTIFKHINIILRINYLTHSLSKVFKVRQSEEKSIHKIINIKLILDLVTNSAPLVLTVLTILIAIIRGDNLNVSDILLIVATFTFVRSSLPAITRFVSAIGTGLASIKRINEFLGTEVKVQREDSPETDNEEVQVHLNGEFEDGTIINHQFSHNSITTFFDHRDYLTSDFLNLIVGLPTTFKGHLKRSGSIQMVDDQPIIIPGTIKENILIGKSYDEVRFNDVIEQCDLAIDLEKFSARENKILLENGENLSGGQRQRISLARVLYSDTDIIIFNNALSSLDSNTKSKIISSIEEKSSKCVINIVNEYCEAYECSTLLKLSSNKVEVFKKSLSQNNNVLKPAQVDTKMKTCKAVFDQQDDKGNIFHKIKYGVKLSYLSIAIISLISYEVLKILSELTIAKKGELVDLNGYFYIAGISFLSLVIARISFAFIAKKSATSLHKKLMDRLTLYKAKSLDQFSFGDLMSRYDRDLDKTILQLPESFTNFLILSTLLLGNIVILFTKSILSSLIIIVLFMFYFSLQKRYRNASDHVLRTINKEGFSELYSALNYFYVASIKPKSSVINFLHENLNTKIKQLLGLTLLQGRLYGWFKVRQGAIFSFYILSIIPLMYYSDEYYYIQVVLTYAILASSIISVLINNSVELVQSFDSFDRIITFSQMKIKKTIVNNYHMPHFSISFHSMMVKNSTTTIQYPEINLTIGKSYALVGRTGVGKTSLLEAIAGHIEVHVKALKIDENIIANNIEGHIGFESCYLPQNAQDFTNAIESDFITADIDLFSSDLLATVDRFLMNKNEPQNKEDVLFKRIMSFASLLYHVFNKDSSFILLDEPGYGIPTELTINLLETLKKHRLKNSILICITHNDKIREYLDLTIDLR